MRFTIESNQKKFFLQNGWLQLESLLEQTDQDQLVKEIERIIQDYPGNHFERGRFLSRSLPLLIKLILKRGWGDLAYTLIDKRPLRLGYDHVFQNPSPSQKEQFHDLFTQPGTVCGLLISLNGSSGTYFLERGFNQLVFSPDGWHLLLAFTTHHLNEDFHPIVTSK